MIHPDVTRQEDLYDQEIDQRILAGQIHPRLIRWYSEDTGNDEPVESAQELTSRYSVCKSCENFVGLVKMCSVCNCFMPIKTQLKKSTCPRGKW
jgi:hypothetical protein